MFLYLVFKYFLAHFVLSSTGYGCFDSVIISAFVINLFRQGHFSVVELCNQSTKYMIRALRLMIFNLPKIKKVSTRQIS